MVQRMVNPVGHYELLSPIVHNQSRTEVLPSGGVAVSVPQRAWAYAATFSLEREPSAEDPTPTYVVRSVSPFCRARRAESWCTAS